MLVCDFKSENIGFHSLIFVDCHISEILAEVVKLCAYPAPQNPLAIDFNHLNDISGTDRLLASGALMQLLEKVIMLTNENKYYIAHGM